MTTGSAKNECDHLQKLEGEALLQILLHWEYSRILADYGKAKRTRILIDLPKDISRVITHELSTNNRVIDYFILQLLKSVHKPNKTMQGHQHHISGAFFAAIVNASILTNGSEGNDLKAKFYSHVDGLSNEELEGLIRFCNNQISVIKHNGSLNHVKQYMAFAGNPMFYDMFFLDELHSYAQNLKSERVVESAQSAAADVTSVHGSDRQDKAAPIQRPGTTVDTLPFKQTIFYENSVGGKLQSHCCQTLLGADVSGNVVEPLLDSFVGLDHAKAFTKDIAMMPLFIRALGAEAKRNGSSSDPETVFRKNNLILSGPPGVGKSTFAKAMGIFFVKSKSVPKDRVCFFEAKALMGEHIGQGPAMIKRAFEFARGGVIILDQFDSFASRKGKSSFFDDDAIKQLVTLMEEENRHGTIFIGTGYVAEMNTLLSVDPGIARRIPAVLHIPPMTNDQLINVFYQHARSLGLTVGAGVVELVSWQLDIARSKMGRGFGNADTVKQILNESLKQAARRWPVDIMSEMVKPDPLLTPETRQKFKTITADDVPIFDPRQNLFYHPQSTNEASPARLTFH